MDPAAEPAVVARSEVPLPPPLPIAAATTPRRGAPPGPLPQPWRVPFPPRASGLNAPATPAAPAAPGKLSDWHPTKRFGGRLSFNPSDSGPRLRHRLRSTSEPVASPPVTSPTGRASRRLSDLVGIPRAAAAQATQSLRARRLSGLSASVVPVAASAAPSADDLALPAPPPMLPVATSCCICLNQFTVNRPGVELPCSRGCSKAPNVHLKCIYEWQEHAAEGNNTCPLCRAPLHKVDYTPPDRLATHTLFMTSARRTFCSRPAPKGAGMVRCFIQVVGTGCMTSTPLRYEMYLQAPHSRAYPSGPVNQGKGPEIGDVLLMTARRFTTKFGASRIVITLDRDDRSFSRQAPGFLGQVTGSLTGLDYTISAPYRFDGPTPFNGSRYVELGSLRFTQNRVGTFAGPRRLQVCLPHVHEDDGTRGAERWPPVPLDLRGEDDEDEDAEKQYFTAAHDPRERKDSLRRVLHKGPRASDQNFIFAHNVQPYFLESLQAYSLDFSGRVTLPSNKNFILSTDADMNSKCLVFGKVAKPGNEAAELTAYTLDFEWPLSPLQAFGIALASADRKYGCA